MQEISLTAIALYDSLLKIKESQTLIHNLTNYVVMQTTANVLLALGALPIMAHARGELADIIGIANALVINIGTLDPEWVQSFLDAQSIAKKCNIPIILDPVGAGASEYRTTIAKELLASGVTLVRGNASEILALCDSENKILTNKGVDSAHESECAINTAHSIAKQYDCCVVISGETDYVCSKECRISVNYGHPILKRVTGMGCSATAVIAAFSAIEENPLLAASYAMVVFGLAAEKAAALTTGPGSFYPMLLDKLYDFHSSDMNSIQYECVSC